MDDHLQERLQQGLQRLKLNLSSDQLSLLGEYLTLLHKWNKAYNLTAIRDPQAMLDLHVLDSLAIMQYIKADNILDVGTGGGLPGVPMAICYPDKKITLLDSNGKKTRFLVHVKQTLGLDNITVKQSRCESAEFDQKFDGIVSRAFASLSDMVIGCRHMLADDGQFYAMKGVMPEQEINELPSDIEVDTVIPLSVPNVDSARHLLLMSFV